MVDFVSSITMFNQEDHKIVAAKEVYFWDIFDKKLFGLFPVLFSLHHFKTYVKHVCEKFITNGYDRLEFRAMIAEIT